jgi:purine nucleoside permease
VYRAIEPPNRARISSLARGLVRTLILSVCCAGLLNAQNTAPAKASMAPIHVKVVVVAMFQDGEDTGNTPGEYHLWVQREHLDQVFPLPAGYHNVRMNKDGVLGLLTGVATAKAAASVMALGLDPRFDLTKAYWVVAGIGGGDPADVSLSSAVWANHVIDGDIGYEIDAREIPKGWPTGFVPMHKSMPYEQPLSSELEGEIYTLNQDLVDWAFGLTKDIPLADSEEMRTARAKYVGFPNALKPPFVTRGDTMSSSTFWHGTLMNQWANEWTRYYTGGKGNYMISAMEDSGTMQALTFLDQAGRVDLKRVLVLRTVSNYDREQPGSTPAEDLKNHATGRAYAAMLPSLEAAETVGDKVVRDIVTHWAERESTIPRGRQ